MRKLLEQGRSNFIKRIQPQVTEAYINKKENPKIFLSVNRNALEMMVNDILDDYLEELPPDHKDRGLKKQPLDGVISALQKKDILPSHISAYMHIIRICGNYGIHDQEGEFEQPFPMMQDVAVQQVLKWYAGTCLGLAFDFEALVGEVSRTRFIVHENTTAREKKKRNPVMRFFSALWWPFGKLFSILFSSIASVLVSLLVISAVYVFLYTQRIVSLPHSIAGFVDNILGLKR